MSANESASDWLNTPDGQSQIIAKDLMVLEIIFLQLTNS